MTQIDNPLIYKVVKHTRNIVETELGREIQLSANTLYEGTDKSAAEAAFTSKLSDSGFVFGETSELFIFNNSMDKLIRRYERTT